VTRPQAPSANPRLPAGRLVFLLFAGICLLAGLDAALVRLAATAPVPSTDLVDRDLLHEPRGGVEGCDPDTI